MTTQGAVFIRSTSIYNDVVAKTISKYSSSKNTIVNYEGQTYGREDFKLISLVKRNKPIHVFVRGFDEKHYQYLGCSIDSSIVKQRKVAVGKPAQKDQRLCVQLVVPTCTPIQVPHDVIYASNNSRHAKYKHDCLAMLGVRNYTTGSLTEQSKFCSKNLNVGFYGW